MSFKTFLIIFGVFFSTNGYTQDKSVKVASIGFYNLENLFDTVDDTLINDEEFLPSGARAWTDDKYREKLGNMAKVISMIGIDKAHNGLSILGVAEIENRKVLKDLVSQDILKSRNYKIIHFDSPDNRGIDVALLYNPSHFTPLHAKTIPLRNYDNDQLIHTRDMLYVKGLLDDDTIHVVVNHWPSRSGGEAKTAPYRNKAAKQNRNIVDSLRSINQDAKIIIMGDLNDDPTSESMKSHLRCVSDIKDVFKTHLFNPFEDMYRRGLGSNAYQDTWSLFDQIVISEGLTKRDLGYHFFAAHVFNKQFLVQTAGQYKGYPFRTFAGDNYQGGYSDHFPSYIYLIREL